MKIRIEAEQIEVNVPDWATLDRMVRERLSARRGFALATLNLDHVVKLRQDPAFRTAYARHDFVTADGNPVVWGAWLQGARMALLPGSDAILPLCRAAAATDRPVALVGATDATLAAAADHLTAQVPGLGIALCIAPPMGFDPEGQAASDILDRLRSDEIGLCFLALGAPRQERFAAFGRTRAPDIGFVSIGAGLDFFAGSQRRAPRWVRRFSMEWLWRMLSDPRRLAPRYLRCGLVLPWFFAQNLLARFGR